MAPIGILTVAILIVFAWMSGRSASGPSEAAADVPISATVPAEAHVALREAQEHFTYNRRPIHPGMVNQFLGWLSDGGPITLAVDVRAGSGSDQYWDQEVRQEGKGVRYETDRDERSGWFSYERIGVLSDETQVLHTMSSGGGTGVFESIMFVRFRLQPHTAEDGAADYRLVMEVVSDHPIGDGDDGKITVMRDHVIASASRYREHDVIFRPIP